MQNSWWRDGLFREKYFTRTGRKYRWNRISRSIKAFSLLTLVSLNQSSMFMIFKKICDGKLVKALPEVPIIPEKKYVVEQETGAIDIIKNKIRENCYVCAKYRNAWTISARSFCEWQYGVVVFKNCGFELYSPIKDTRITKWYIYRIFESEVVGNIHWRFWIVGGEMRLYKLLKDLPTVKAGQSSKKKN